MGSCVPVQRKQKPAIAYDETDETYTSYTTTLSGAYPGMNTLHPRPRGIRWSLSQSYSHEPELFEIKVTQYQSGDESLSNEKFDSGVESKSCVYDAVESESSVENSEVEHSRNISVESECLEDGSDFECELSRQEDILSIGSYSFSHSEGEQFYQGNQISVEPEFLGNDCLLEEEHSEQTNEICLQILIESPQETSHFNEGRFSVANHDLCVENRALLSIDQKEEEITDSEGWEESSDSEWPGLPDTGCESPKAEDPIFECLPERLVKSSSWPSMSRKEVQLPLTEPVMRATRSECAFGTECCEWLTKFEPRSLSNGKCFICKEYYKELYGCKACRLQFCRNCREQGETFHQPVKTRQDTTAVLSSAKLRLEDIDARLDVCRKLQTTDRKTLDMQSERTHLEDLRRELADLQTNKLADCGFDESIIFIILGFIRVEHPSEDVQTAVRDSAFDLLGEGSVMADEICFYEKQIDKTDTVKLYDLEQIVAHQKRLVAERMDLMQQIQILEKQKLLQGIMYVMKISKSEAEEVARNNENNPVAVLAFLTSFLLEDAEALLQTHNGDFESALQIVLPIEDETQTKTVQTARAQNVQKVMEVCNVSQQHAENLLTIYQNDVNAIMDSL